jgi:hypothetical protein
MLVLAGALPTPRIRFLESTLYAEGLQETAGFLLANGT